jgi:uncharacterized protein
MKAELSALYALQQLDSTIDRLKREFAALDAGQSEKAAHDSAKTALEEATTALHADTTNLRDAELEQKSVETKKAEYEKKLYGGTVSNPKELMAMTDEVAMLERQRARLEEKILGLMNEIETRRTTEKQAQHHAGQTRQAMKAKQADYKKTAESIAGMARALIKQREAAVKKIKPDLLKRYEALRISKGGLAIVPLEDGNACGGCKMGLPSMLVVRVHEGSAIEVCQNCKRILCEAPAITT